MTVIRTRVGPALIREDRTPIRVAAPVGRGHKWLLIALALLVALLIAMPAFT